MNKGITIWNEKTHENDRLIKAPDFGPSFTIYRNWELGMQRTFNVSKLKKTYSREIVRCLRRDIREQ